MFEKILIQVVDPRGGVPSALEFGEHFSIGSKRTDVIIDSEFVDSKHGEFDYNRAIGWHYFDSIDAKTPTTIKGTDGKIHTCQKGKPVTIKTGDELILNKIVKIKILRIISHTGEILKPA